MISENDKIALVVCSNGKKIEDRARLEKLEVVLKEMSLVPVFSTYVCLRREIRKKCFS